MPDDEHEIEITPEMIESGVGVLHSVLWEMEYDNGYLCPDKEDLVTVVFRRMESFRPTKDGRSLTLDELLAELDWTKRDLAKRLGLHRNTISRWKEPPAAVMAYLKLRVGIQRLLDD